MVHSKAWVVPLILFGVALAMGLWYLSANPGANIIGEDSAQYDGYARSILSGKGYAYGNLLAHRPPGYPFFLSLIYLLFSYSFLAVKIAQCFLNAFTCVITYFIGKKIGGYKVGLLSGLILSFLLDFWGMSPKIMSECLFAFLLSLSVLILLNKNNLRIKNIVWSAVLMGLSALVRPLTILLPFFILLWMMKKDGWLQMKTYLNFIIFLLVFSSVLSPWIIRNYKIYHKVVISTTGGQTFAGGNNARSKGGWVLRNSMSAKDINEVEKDKVFYEEGIKSLKNLNPLQLFKLYTLKVWRLFSPFHPAYDITFGLIFPFFIMGLFYFRQNNEFDLSLPFLLICYLLVTTLIFYGSFRMRSPYLPYIAVFAATGFYQSFGKLRMVSGVEPFFTKYRRAFNFIILWIIFNLVVYWMNYSYGVFL